MELKEVIERISLLRVREGLSARELSLRIGKNEAYINRLEYRKNFEPSISVINDISEACNSSLEEEYKNDKKIINLLRKVKPEIKQSIINILENM